MIMIIRTTDIAVPFANRNSEDKFKAVLKDRVINLLDARAFGFHS